jgi:hypothetical protein
MNIAERPGILVSFTLTINSLMMCSLNAISASCCRVSIGQEFTRLSIPMPTLFCVEADIHVMASVQIVLSKTIRLLVWWSAKDA